MDALQVVMTILHAGGKFGGSGYKVSGGLHGVGVSVVNALSERTVVEVHREGKIFTQSFERGKPASAVRTIAKATLPPPPLVPWREQPRTTGTVTRFAPDPQMFPVIEWDVSVITQWLRETAYLNKGLWLALHDERNASEENYYFDGGVISFVRHLNKAHQNLHPKPVYVERSFENGTIAEIALQYNDSYAEKVYTFANNINTIDGGAHLTGFRTALTRTINAYARKSGQLKEADPNLTSDDVREGLTAVISVKIREPQFEGQTKTRLGNAEVAGQIATALNDALGAFLDENPPDAKRIVEKCLTAFRAREPARKARDVFRKAALEGFPLPRMLADADVDGAHIRTLLLALLYRHFRPLVEEGRIYIGQPPLYRLQLGKDVRWVYSDLQRDKAIKDLKGLAKAKRDKRMEKGTEEAPKGGRRATAVQPGADDETARASQ